MATLRNERKLAAVTRETQEEHPRSGQSRNTPVPRINEEYITQVSEEIEGRTTKKLSQEFNRIESRISDALSKLDEFLSNQQIQTHSKTVPGTFRSTNVENQGTNEDDSQSDPHLEAGIFHGQTTQNSGPKECPDKYNIFLELYVQKIKHVRSTVKKICWIGAKVPKHWSQARYENKYCKKTRVIDKFLAVRNSSEFPILSRKQYKIIRLHLCSL